MKNFSRYLICIFFSAIVLSGCGGGGGGSEPTPPSGGQPPVQPPPTPQRPTALVPEYTGITTDYIITNANIGETVISTLSVLDFLNQIVFDNQYESSLFIVQSPNIPYTSENLACESGSSNTTENPATTEVKIEYTNCVIEGDRLNGTTQGFVDNSSGVDRATINIDLSIETLADNTTLSLLGNIVVTAQGNLIYNLLLTDSEDTLWFDNLVAFVDEINLSLYFQGDIYLVSSGKLSIATNTIAFDFEQNATVFDLDITGDQTLAVNIVRGQTLSISAASLSSPLLLDLTNFTGLPSTNLPPLALAESEGSAFYDDFIAVNGALSSDPNLQAITLDWQVLSQVEEAEVIIQVDGQVASVSANRPGEYIIRLTATDPLGESDQTDISLNFTRRPPQASLNFGSQIYDYGSVVTAIAEISSPEFDGPYELSLEYAPEGMQINDSGELSWTVNLPNLGQSLMVNAGVRVTSPEFSTLIEGQLIARPVQSAKRIPINTTLSRNYTFAQDSQEPILLSNRGVFDLGFEGQELSLSPHSVPDNIAEFSSGIVHIADIDEDGDLDYFVTEQDPATLAHRLWSIDTDGNRKLYSEFSIGLDEAFNLDILILDVSDLPGKEIVLINREFGDFFQVLSNDGELLGTQGPLQTPWCDINEDGKVDWLTDSGYRLFDEAETSPLVLDMFLVLAKPSYKGLSNDCSLYGYRMDEQGLPVELVAVNPFAAGEANGETVIANVAELATQFNIPSYFNVSVTELNIDNDAADELIVRFLTNDESVQILLIDDAGTQTQSAGIIDVDPMQSSLQPFGVQFTQILDINDDGIDEIITFNNDQFQPTGSIQASFLNGNMVSQFSHSPTLSLGLGLIDYWDGSRGVINTGTDSLIDLSLAADSAEQTQIDEVNFTSIIAQELGQKFIYEVLSNPNSGALELSKQTLDGTTIYSTPVTESDSATFGYGVGEINDEYLLMTGVQPAIVRRDTGEVVYRFPASSNAMVMNNRKYLVPTENESEGFVVAYDDTSLYVAALTQNGGVEGYAFSELEGLLNFNFSRASLIQVNNTPALDFVMHLGFFGDEDVLTIDFKNRVITELPQSVFANIKEPEPNLGLLSRCIENSQTCQNSIYGKGNNSFTGFGHVYGVDAITGDTVWRTQQEFVDLKNMAIAKDGNTFKSLMISGEDVFVLE
jgi:outer membrane protein assembly factor BamB